MLKKKSGFKPKAAVRRPAPTTSTSQDVERGRTAERLSSTPAPTSAPAPAPAPVSTLGQDPVTSSRPSPPAQLAFASQQDTTTPLVTQGHGDSTFVTTVGPDTSTSSTGPKSTGLADNDSGSQGTEPQADTSTVTNNPTAELFTRPEHAVSRAAIISQALKSSSSEISTAAVSSSERLVSEDPPATVPAATKAPSSEAEASTPQIATPQVAETTAPLPPNTSTQSTTESLSSSLPPTSSTTSRAASTSTPLQPTRSTSPRTSVTPGILPEQQSSLQIQHPQVVISPADGAESSRSQTAVEDATEPSTQAAPPAAPKAKRGRKRKADGATGEGTDQTNSAAAPAPKKRPRAKRDAPLPGEEGHSGTAEGQAAPRTTRGRKRKATAATEGPNEGDKGSESQAKRTPARQREMTPENAEELQLDATQVKMADLAKDMHIGKKFSLHEELMERERTKRQKEYERRRQRKNGASSDGTPNGQEEQAGGAAGSGPSANGESAPAVDGDAGGSAGVAPAGRTGILGPAGETYQIIDGEIVLDARSLQVDRHARAAREAGEMEEHEENEFTNHTTSATYLRRKMKAGQWSDEDTEKFYHALRMFGTDFETISRMFHDKTRKHVKLKFNREERSNSAAIRAALVGEKTVGMSIDEYKQYTGQEYETAEAIYAQQKKAEEEFEARQKAIADEKAEELRKKKEALFGAPDADDAGTGSKKGRRGRGKRAKSGAVGL